MALPQPMRGKSMTYRHGPSHKWAVYDRRTGRRPLSNKGERFGKVVDLPRINMAEPLRQGMQVASLPRSILRNGLERTGLERSSPVALSDSRLLGNCKRDACAPVRLLFQIRVCSAIASETLALQ